MVDKSAVVVFLSIVVLMAVLGQMYVMNLSQADMPKIGSMEAFYIDANMPWLVMEQRVACYQGCHHFDDLHDRHGECLDMCAGRFMHGAEPVEE